MIQKQRFDSLAQQVEHNTFNVGVLGSSPRRITKKASKTEAFFRLCLKYKIFERFADSIIFYRRSYIIGRFFQYLIGIAHCYTYACFLNDGDVVSAVAKSHCFFNTYTFITDNIQ